MDTTQTATTQSRFQVEIARDEDFPEMMAAMWEGFENPYQGLLRLFFPVLNNDYATSLDTCVQGQLAEYRSEKPRLVWITIVDTETDNKIVAAAKWYFYQENPYARDEAPLVADWYPEGIGRDIATKAARQFEHPREMMARRPHAFLHITFTLPEYRRRGLNRILVEWGLKRADDLGLEAWLDASEFGGSLYAQYGFRKVLFHSLSPQPPENLTEAERDEWAMYEKTLLPVDATVMWRPPRGEYVEGVTVKPWEQEGTLN